MIETKKLILVAEDEPILQRAYERLLGKRYLVKIVSNAKDAIAILRNIQPDVIISNWFLAAGSGLEILTWIRANQPKNVSKFIFLSGYPIPPDVHPRVLIKPANPAEVLTAIEDIRS